MAAWKRWPVIRPKGGGGGRKLAQLQRVCRPGGLKDLLCGTFSKAEVRNWPKAMRPHQGGGQPSTAACVSQRSEPQANHGQTPGPTPATRPWGLPWVAWKMGLRWGISSWVEHKYSYKAETRKEPPLDNIACKLLCISS